MQHAQAARNATAATTIVVAFAALGCVAYKSGRLQPGFMLPISEPARDPSPMLDPTEMYRPRNLNEHGTQAPAKLPPWLSPRVQEILALLAGVGTGALPLLNFVVTFDENAWFDKPVAPSP